MRSDTPWDFQHNFAASTYGRASVMEYPAPLIGINGDKLDFNSAYATGTGAWDDQTVRYAYTQFADSAEESAGLDAILRDGIKRGLLFLSDEDSNEEDGADPRSNRWDNGNDPVQNLRHSLRIRAIGMSNFGLRNLHEGQADASLEQVFGPLYFFHRYDVDATAKVVGGFHYVHAVKGDGQSPQTAIPGTQQREALSALLDCLRPDVLLVPQNIAELIGPRPNGAPPSSELFAHKASYIFDSLAAANSAADMVISRLLNPARCARIVELSTRDTSEPSLDEVLATMSAAIIKQPVGTTREREIAWGNQHVYVTRLMELAEADTSYSVLARADKALATILATERLITKTDSSGHAQALAREISRFLSRPHTDSQKRHDPSPPLPGAPIGG